MAGPRVPGGPLSLQQVHLSLGSNLGERLGHLEEAVERLRPLLRGLRVSSVYETDPLYFTAQPRFYNIALTGCTSLAPRRLLERVLAIEDELGRRREGAPAKGPRPIDIDILLYGGRVIREEGLRIPHPGLPERRFVLEPLLELEPGLRDPASGKAYADLLAVLPPQGVAIVRPWAYTRGTEPEHDRGHPGREAEL